MDNLRCHILLALVAAVNSQSYPRFEFRGDVLANKSASYVIPVSESVWCNVCYTVTTGISVLLSGTISREIGVPYTLTCTVLLSHTVIDSSVSIQWQGPSTDGQEIASNDRVIVNELILDPLTLTHGGDYTCTAVYTVDGYTATVRSVESVVPISELSPQFITNCYDHFSSTSICVGKK